MKNENNKTVLQNDKNKDNKLTPGVFLEIYTLGYLIIKEEPVYSNEILESISDVNPVWTPSHGTYIPIINNLAKEGFIDRVSATDDKRKKYYVITDSGKEYYNYRAEAFKKMLITTSNFYNTVASSIPDSEK